MKGRTCIKRMAWHDSDEKAYGVHRALMTCLENYELDIRNVTAYAADNVNINYGKHPSVYKLLSSANEGILKANCPAHIAHSACKHASDQLAVDIDCFNFSVSATRTEELRSFFAFVDMEWREILRHVCTRWLSLTTVSRLLETWPALTSYFRSNGENCPVVLRSLLEDEVKTNTAEIYLWDVFLINLLRS